MSDRNNDSEFERRMAALLQDSADHLPGSVRSRLTQARHAALAARADSGSVWWTRRLLPAGAVAAAALVALLVVIPHRAAVPTTPMVAAASPEDMELLLTDSDAVTLTSDQDVDDDFYEWAANEASGAGTSSVGT